jgi:hypothetical protein
MPLFSDFAYDKMIDLYDHHDDQVGSNLKKSNPTLYEDFKSTDCITYVINVLAHGFESVGDPAAAKKVWSLGKYGTQLAAYLVNTHRWKGVYVNPDTVHPVDADPEHNYTNTVVTKKCVYYKIPMAYKVTDYNATPATDPNFQKLRPKAGVTTLNTVDIASLDSVKFGIGVSRGGMHTWLFSYGQVYEVHYDNVGADLYEASPLRTFGYLSSGIIVPPDQVGVLSVSTKLKCG